MGVVAAACAGNGFNKDVHAAGMFSRD